MQDKNTNASEAVVHLEISTMLSEETVVLGQGNKGFFTNPFIICKKKWYDSLYDKPKMPQVLYYIKQFKMAAVKQIRETIQ